MTPFFYPSYYALIKAALPLTGTPVAFAWPIAVTRMYHMTRTRFHTEDNYHSPGTPEHALARSCPVIAMGPRS